MKTMTKTALLIASMAVSAGVAFGADAAANWSQHCASCHGKDGTGNTTMGKKNNVKDYTDAKVQAAFSDGEAAKTIKEGVKEGGKEKMKSYKDKLSDDEVKALVAYIRAFKK